MATLIKASLIVRYNGVAAYLLFCLLLCAQCCSSGEHPCPVDICGALLSVVVLGARFKYGSTALELSDKLALLLYIFLRN